MKHVNAIESLLAVRESWRCPFSPCPIWLLARYWKAFKPNAERFIGGQWGITILYRSASPWNWNVKTKSPCINVSHSASRSLLGYPTYFGSDGLTFLYSVPFSSYSRPPVNRICCNWTAGCAGSVYIFSNFFFHMTQKEPTELCWEACLERSVLTRLK